MVDRGSVDSTLSGLDRKSVEEEMRGELQGAIDLFTNKPFALPKQLFFS